MFFNAALFSTVFLVPAVLAVPSGIGGNIARSQPQVTDCANFTGAVLAVSNVAFDSVTATFTVPTASGSTGATTVAAIGFSCPTGSDLYAGVAFTVAPNGQSEYTPYFQLNNSSLTNLSDTTVSAGDSIRVTVALLTTSANVTIENLTNNETAKKTLTSGPVPFCRQYGVWFVDDTIGQLFDFGTLTYTNALASSNGTYYAPYGSNTSLVDMVQNGQTVVTTSISSENITIKYNV